MRKSLHSQTAMRLSSLTLTILLGACTSLAPRYERPQAPVAAAWPAGSAPLADAKTADAKAVVAGEIAWRDFFSDKPVHS